MGEVGYDTEKTVLYMALSFSSGTFSIMSTQYSMPQLRKDEIFPRSSLADVSTKYPLLMMMKLTAPYPTTHQKI